MDEKTKVPSFIGNSHEDNIWFSDYSSQTFADQKNVFGDTYLLTGFANEYSMEDGAAMRPGR